MRLTISDIADLVSKGSACESVLWRAANSALVDAAEAGEIEAERVKPQQLLCFTAGRRQPAPVRSAPLEINSSSRVDVGDAAKVLTAERIPLGGLLELLPQEERRKYDPKAEADALKAQKAERKAEAEAEKYPVLVGALAHALASKGGRYKRGERLNMEQISEVLLPYLTTRDDEAIHGWGKSSLKALLTVGIDAFEQLSNES